jgi:hypothetical protein
VSDTVYPGTRIKINISLPTLSTSVENADLTKTIPKEDTKELLESTTKGDWEFALEGLVVGDVANFRC